MQNWHSRSRIPDSKDVYKATLINVDLSLKWWVFLFVRKHYVKWMTKTFWYWSVRHVIKWQVDINMTSQHNYLTSRHQDVTSRHDYLTRGDRTILHTYLSALITTGFHLKCSTPYSSGQFWLLRSYSKTLLSTVRYILTIFFNALNSYIKDKQSSALYGRCNINVFEKKNKA